MLWFLPILWHKWSWAFDEVFSQIMLYSQMSLGRSAMMVVMALRPAEACRILPSKATSCNHLLTVCC